MKLKRFLCAALALMMLSGAALAAETTEVTDLNPMNPGPAAMPQFEVASRNDDSSIYVWGKATLQGEKSVYLENSNENSSYSKIVLHVSEDTIIVDAVTGEAKTYADLKDGENLQAWVSPAMTRSIPPQTTAALILCNIPADYMPPRYAQVQSVNEREDGGLDVLTSDAVILHMSKDTELLSYKTKNVPALADIKPGMMVLSWYSVVAMSMPAQTTPGKVMLLGNHYDGYVQALPGALTVNGTKVELGVNEAPYVHEGKLMVPVRKFAEALGCTVTWDAETPDAVTMAKDGKTFCTTAIGSDNMTVDGDMVFTLSTPAIANNRVTFMCIDDLLSPFNVKYSPLSIFFG